MFQPPVFDPPFAYQKFPNMYIYLLHLDPSEGSKSCRWHKYDKLIMDHKSHVLSYFFGDIVAEACIVRPINCF